MIETNGWDTHSGQRGRLAAQHFSIEPSRVMTALFPHSRAPALGQAVISS
jgi:hypothetical protein